MSKFQQLSASTLQKRKSHKPPSDHAKWSCDHIDLPRPAVHQFQMHPWRAAAVHMNMNNIHPPEKKTSLT